MHASARYDLVNVNVVILFDHLGLECVWRDLTPKEEEAWEWKNEPGSSGDEPIYGVMVLVDGEPCTLWQTQDGMIYRSNTEAEDAIQEGENA